MKEEKMILTDEMQRAMDMIEASDTPLYITGKAGTGKTTLLKYIIKHMRKNFVVAAPTGIAAINCDGMTLNSLFQIPFGIVTKADAMKSRTSPGRMELLNELDILIIDEISMVNPCIMDFIDIKLQICRSNPDPFGGVKVIMFGDLYQLPPVVTDDEMDALMSEYDDVYFFNSHVIIEGGLNVVALNTVFRQKDPEFVDALNNIREYKATSDDFELFTETRDLSNSKDMDAKSIHICAFKRDAVRINLEMLGEHTNLYTGKVVGKFSSNRPAEEQLYLRVGARIMTLCNDQNHQYYNGSLGIIESLSDKVIKVKLDDGQVVSVIQNTWKEYEYKVGPDKTIGKAEKGSYTQFPIALAWAITVHKSQGLSFDSVTLHLKRVFASGQLYVALSRCRTLEGITTDSFISKKHIISNPALVKFEESYTNNGMSISPQSINYK